MNSKIGSANYMKKLIQDYIDDFNSKQILFNGRNFNGQAFGGLDKNEIYEVMNKIKDK